MKITEIMTFSNNGYIVGETTYKLELVNPLENKTHTFLDTEIVTSKRFLTMTINSNELNKGTYKGKLYVNDVLFYEFIAQKPLVKSTTYTNDVRKERYTHER